MILPSILQSESFMPLSDVSGRYYQSDSEFPRNISWQQLLVLHVAANYNLTRSSRGWWADGHVWPDGVVRIHSADTIKSLLKSGLLEGNSRGEKIASGGWDGISTTEHPIPMLWSSPKGKKLLEKINKETGLAFDKRNYELIAPGTDEAADGIALGHFATEREAALAHDRAAILIYGDDANTNFPPEESEHVVLSDEVMRSRRVEGGYSSRELSGSCLRPSSSNFLC